MADFAYTARTKSGESINGVIGAVSEEQAVFSLHQKELTILSIDLVEKSAMHSDIFEFFRRPNKKDIIIFTTQLATLIEADVPLLEAFTILNKQTEKPTFKKIISDITTSIEGGASLSNALSEHERVFNRFYTSMVKVGEVSGRLQETLTYLAAHLEESSDISSKIKGAIFYPVFVLSALAIVSVIMITTVIPQLITIIKDSGVVDLPLPTKILIWVSSFFSTYGLFVLILLIFAIIATYEYARTQKGKLAWDRFKINMPKFGKIVKDFYISRFAETLSTLIHAGVSILEAVEISANVVGNEIYKNILMEARRDIQGGSLLSASLQKHEEFPQLAVSMIATGERTGRTDFMLQHVLKFYKTEAQNDVRNLSQLIEPLLILLLGIGIGTLIAAVLLPIYSLISAV